MTLAKEGPREIRVGLLWHSARSGNLGVGALTIANLLLAKRAAAKVGLAARFEIIGTGSDLPSYAPPHVDYKIVDRRYLLGASGYRADLQSLDCILDIGGGDSFADIYGPKRFAFLWLTKVIALRHRKPLLLSPQTIGPFTKFPYRKLAAWTLNRADAVVARDSMSMDALRQMAPNAQAIQSVDVAFALPYERQAKAAAKRRIGLNVSGLLFNESVSGRNQYGLGYNYAAFCRKLLGELLSRSWDVELLCHVTAPNESVDDDGAVADLLASEFPGVTRVAAFASPSDAKSYISGLDFLVAGRMHACIAAYSAGVPFVATAYSRKFTGLFGMLDYPAILPRSGVNEDEAIGFVLSALEQAPELAKAIQHGNRQIDALVDNYVEALSVFFMRVAVNIPAGVPQYGSPA